MRAWLTTVAEVAGYGLVSFGFWLAWAPLGFIAAGASVLASVFFASEDGDA